MSLTGQPIVILGMYRSGTSAVSGALVELGLYMGTEEALFSPNEFNPDGHWELKDMMVLNERLIKALRSDYFPARWLPDSWSEEPFTDRMVADLRGLLNRHFSNRSHWGWKEPATSILLPLYKAALTEEGVAGRYLICARHPMSVLSSLLKRFISTPMESFSTGPQDLPGIKERLMSMWVSYMLSALRETKGATRHLMVYERFLQEPMKYVERLSNGFLTWQPTTEQKQAAAATVKPQLSHSKYGPGHELRDWPTIVGRTYDLCLRADEDPEGFSSGAFDLEIDALWQEWSTTRQMVQPLTLPAGQLILSWDAPDGPEKHEEDYVPFGEPLRFRFKVDAPARSTLRFDPYQHPSHLWIRRVAWHLGGEEYVAALKEGPGGLLEDISGMQRLTVFGPDALEIQTPSLAGPYELEFEFHVKADVPALVNIVKALGQRVSATKD
jgi:hypothetical protein